MDIPYPSRGGPVRAFERDRSGSAHPADKGFGTHVCPDGTVLKARAVTRPDDGAYVQTRRYPDGIAVRTVTRLDGSEVRTVIRLLNPGTKR